MGQNIYRTWVRNRAREAIVCKLLGCIWQTDTQRKAVTANFRLRITEEAFVDAFGNFHSTF